MPSSPLPRCCGGKIRYPSERAARRTRRHLSARVRIYPCPRFHGFHLTKRSEPYMGASPSGRRLTQRESNPDNYGRMRSRRQPHHRQEAHMSEEKDRKPGSYFVDYLGSKAGTPRLFRAGDGKKTVDSTLDLTSARVLEDIAEALNHKQTPNAPSAVEEAQARKKEAEKEVAARNKRK